MKESTHKALVVVLISVLARPCLAAPALTADITVSSAAVSKHDPSTFHFDFQKGTGPQGRSSVGIDVGLNEGKPLDRKLSGQLKLFKNPIKYRAIITSFPETMTALEVLDHHNDRGRMEKALDELKEGFGLDRLPCGQLMANAAYLQVCLIAYNLVQLFKSVALPKGWKKFEIKNLRFRLLCRAAKLVSHTGYVVSKLRDFAFFDVFEQARWAVLSPTLEVSG